MHLIIGIILVSVFFGFILSPKGSNAQTVIRRGLLSLLGLLAIAAIVGGIYYWIDKTQTERKLANQQEYTPTVEYSLPSQPQIEISGSWYSETESITDFTIFQDGSKITMSKFNFNAKQSGKPNYTVIGQIEGNSVVFSNDILSGKLTLKSKNYSRELIGNVKEKGHEVVFVLDER